MSSNDSKCSVPLTPGMVVGLAFSAKASLLSLLSVLFLAGWVTLKYWRNLKDPPEGPWRLLRTNIDAYMINLLFAELVVAIGGLIDAKWAIEQRTYCGGACTAQGALAQIGITAAAFFIIAISVQTWYSIYYVHQTSYSFSTWFGFSVFTWGYVTLFAVIGWSIHPDFYVPTPLWCWIGREYPVERIWGQYLWIWICAFGNILVYVPLYLFSRGNLDFEETGNGGVRWRWYRHALNDPDRAELRSEAWKMLLYPFAYSIQVLGFSIVRWMSYHNPSLNDIQRPELAGMAAASLACRWVFRLSGFVNVILILTTRPNVLLFGGRGSLAENDPRAIRDRELQQYNGSNTETEQDLPMDKLPQRPESMRMY